MGNSVSPAAATAPTLTAGTKDAILAHQMHEYSFAQTTVGDAQARARPHPHQCLENGAAGKNEICAVAANAGLGDALRIAAAQQVVDNIARGRRIEPAAVDAVAIIARQTEINSGDRCHRSRCAEQVVRARRHAFDNSMFRFKRPQHRHHVLDHKLENLGCDVTTAELLGERNDTNRKRGPRDDRLLHSSPANKPAAQLGGCPRHVEPDQLGGSSADVEYQDMIGLRVDQ